MNLVIFHFGCILDCIIYPGRYQDLIGVLTVKRICQRERTALCTLCLPMPCLVFVASICFTCDLKYGYDGDCTWITYAVSCQKSFATFVEQLVHKNKKEGSSFQLQDSASSWRRRCFLSARVLQRFFCLKYNDKSDLGLAQKTHLLPHKFRPHMSKNKLQETTCHAIFGCKTAVLLFSRPKYWKEKSHVFSVCF